ncbi:MAG: cytochrome c biogenesis protein CcsA [Planctomycetes bacterium]|nr:cytochrome c biogenesis protein CcsA [Planctomycetota bacterium]
MSGGIQTVINSFPLVERALFYSGGACLLAGSIAAAVRAFAPDHLPPAVLRVAAAGGVALHGALVAARWSAEGRAPLIHGFEATLLTAVFILAVYLLFGRRSQTLDLGIFVLPLAFCLALATALLAGEVSERDLSPVSGAALTLHVGTALLAYAVLALSSAAAALYLWQSRLLKSKASSAWAGRLPPLGQTERLIFACARASFPLMTFSLAVGFSWAATAATSPLRDWLRHPKVISALALWAVSLALFGVSIRASYHGRRLAYLALLGFAGLLATLLGTHFIGAPPHADLLRP